MCANGATHVHSATLRKSTFTMTPKPALRARPPRPTLWPAALVIEILFGCESQLAGRIFGNFRGEYGYSY